MNHWSLLNRRDVLTTAAGASTLLLLGLTGGCESLLDQIRNRPVRKDIGTLSPNDPIVETYRDGVVQMRNLASSDGRNWLAQADIHRDWCPHGNWYFLPWHRAYLFYFEKIIQKLTGEDKFGLPYWNWQRNPQIPAAFWGAGNPLNHTPRTATPSSTASASAVGASVIEGILDIDENNFFLFASEQSATQRGFSGFGQLEGNPHNYIHGFVGGDMGFVPTAGRDPIFWCHHCMVDCLWAEWNIARGNRNTNDSAWTGFTFTGNFVDADGNSADIGVLATILMPLLSYRYEVSTKGVRPLTAADIDVEDLRRFLEAGAAVQTRLPRPAIIRDGIELRAAAPGAAIRLPGDALRAALARDGETRVILSLGGIDQPARGDYFVRVFLGDIAADESTPIEDPHYAGSFAFFPGADEHMDTVAFNVDATATLQRLARMGEFSAGVDSLPLRLVAVPISDRRPAMEPLSVRRIGLGASQIVRSPRQQE